jgi:hypothetical protein
MNAITLEEWILIGHWAEDEMAANEKARANNDEPPYPDTDALIDKLAAMVSHTEGATQ